MNGDLYDVNKYTDEELYNILDLVNPSDRELEAKIFHMISKYKNMQNESGDKLTKFFNDIYARFFEIVDESKEDKVIENAVNMEETPIVITQDYAKGTMNPLLNQLINRIISIDSQYRDAKRTTIATNFTFNLSETLHNVLAVRLNSIQIPKTWYTISKSYGANFFYLKGNKPGINDGNHDYKIEIPVGNYTSQQVIDAVNTSITTIKNTYTDACFGSTEFSYDINTCKATFTIDYNKIFNETDFAIIFPTFSHPVDASNTKKFTTLPQILGIDSSFIPINSIDSNYFVDISKNYNITNSNNYFTILNYNGYDSINNNYISANLSYNRAIDLSFNSITIQPARLKPGSSYDNQLIVDAFNEELQKNVNLSGAYIEKVNVTDVSMTGYGKSYYKFVVPLNYYNINNVENMKTAIIFPQSDLWIGSNSCFHFDTSINEISTIKSNANINISDYSIGSNVYFTFVCDASGYKYSEFNNNNTSSNNIRVFLNQGSYSLTNYIAEINNSINEVDAVNNNFFSGNAKSGISNFAINTITDNFLRMRFFIQKKFTTNMYLLDCFYDCYFNYLNFKYHNYDLSVNNPSNISAILSPAPTYYNLGSGSLFKILPNTTSKLGNKAAQAFNITIDSSAIYNNLHNIVLSDSIIEIIRNNYDSSNQIFTELDVNSLSQILQWSIQNWVDPVLDNKPLKNSKISMSLDLSNNAYVSYYILRTSMDLSINTQLLAKDYRVIFTDTVNNSWSNYLFLDNSYNLKDWSYNTIANVPYVYNTGTNKIYGNLITLDNTNNYFYLQPNASGVSDSTNANRIEIRINASPNGTSYTLNEIINSIQAEFDILLYGSKIYRDASNTYIRINHTKSYTTEDYRIVFYDPYSFVRCFVGASSIKNTSWDTTLGWILGFRELTEYPIGINYVEYDVNSNVTYYTNTKSYYRYISDTNIAIIVGDTTVSVNLYNYFMIVLNDYVQNHLNDGLVGIAPAETSIPSASYANRGTYTCDPVTGNKIFVGTNNGSNNNTSNQIYAENQKLLSMKQKIKSYSAGPFVQDVFAIIPLNTGNIPNGSVYVETGSGLQKQERVYFGPVNLSRMNIQLITDRGDIVDLNGSDWSCTLQCDLLYQNKNV
jgi:hypothetical protein